MSYLFHYILHPDEEMDLETLLRLYGLEEHKTRCLVFGPGAVHFRGMIHLYPRPETGYREHRKALEEGLLKGTQRQRLIRAGMIIEKPEE